MMVAVVIAIPNAAMLIVKMINFVSAIIYE